MSGCESGLVAGCLEMHRAMSVSHMKAKPAAPALMRAVRFAQSHMPRSIPVVWTDQMWSLAVSSMAAVDGSEIITEMDLQMRVSGDQLWFTPPIPIPGWPGHRGTGFLIARTSPEELTYSMLVIKDGWASPSSTDIMGVLRIGDPLPSMSVHQSGVKMSTPPVQITSGLRVMNQKLVDIDRAVATRAVRRKRQRAGESPLPECRIIRLREILGAKREAEDGGRLHHQFIVGWPNGFWRRQWYPSIEQHRPILVAPFVKGPEGAPFVTPRGRAVSVER